mgnify:CR=1 FL=1
MKFVLATQNAGKVKEMSAILAQFDIEVISAKDAGIHLDVEETGTTFAENAMLKAKAICEASNLPAIADDSGLCGCAQWRSRCVFRPLRWRGFG